MLFAPTQTKQAARSESTRIARLQLPKALLHWQDERPICLSQLADWRGQFDLTVTGPGPVEMRLYLRAGDKILSETWLYQYHPF